MKNGLPVLLLAAACTGVIDGGGGSGGGSGTGGAGPDPVCDAACQAAAHPDPSTCVSSRQYFEQYAWPQVFSVCVSCHVAGGQADGTRFMLKATSLPNHIEQNFAAVNTAATLTSNGEPLLLLKPTMRLPHQGGVQVQPGTVRYAVLEETLKQAAMPVTCGGPMLPPPTPVTAGVTLLSPYETLRKATMILASRPPTAAEVAAVDANGMPAVETAVLGLMNESAFYEKVREIFSDVLLTDAFMFANRDTHGGGLLWDDTFDAPANDFGGMPDWQWQSSEAGIKTTDALAREPVEFFVHAARLDRPLTEVLTADYRLMNAHTARFFGVAYTGDPNDPHDFREVKVPVTNERRGPGEYAGILTTTAFLSRYPNTPTNFNRKRARFTYKYFLAYDIMKVASRIDASAIDLAANPTRNNPACTGCHAKIDPFAGALANWTECGYSDHPHYFTPAEKSASCNDRGWVPESRAFPPGIDEGTVRPLTDAERPRGAAVLAAAIVQRDGFAQAMVQHVAQGVLNRPLLSAPQDPMHPAYAHLDAAFEYEKAELARLTTAFKQNGMKLKPLVLAVVLSPLFRAAKADRADRMELSGQGGGTLVTPEDLDRRLVSLLGQPWMEIAPNGAAHDVGPRYLRRAAMFKVSYGGTDQSLEGQKVRQRLPSSITARVVERMALMMSCIATSRDFDEPVASRLLFPHVDATVVPSGNASAADQQPILRNLQHLHERLLGERLALDSPELLATYQLLSQARTDFASSGAGMRLARPCANDVDVQTGAARVPAGTVNDPQFVVRAWQTVIAYLLMDYRFIMEP